MTQSKGKNTNGIMLQTRRHYPPKKFTESEMTFWVEESMVERGCFGGTDHIPAPCTSDWHARHFKLGERAFK